MSQAQSPPGGVVKNLALAAAGILATASFIGLASGPASASADCGTRAPADKDTSNPIATGQFAVYNGSHTTCHLVGDFAKGDKLNYFCYTVNPNSGQTWTYLVDLDNPLVKGWTNDNNLPNGGSIHPCL
jgi:hypothetical protein